MPLASAEEPIAFGNIPALLRGLVLSFNAPMACALQNNVLPLNSEKQNYMLK